MESSRAGALPVDEPRRFPVAPVVFGVIVAAVAVWIGVAVTNSRGPEETVEAYLEAVADKDIDGALELVTRYGYGVPYGDDAVFLTPEAISDDWWVVSVTEVDREYGTEARVKAVIAGPGGTAAGMFTVNEYDDEWLMSDPFVNVEFPASPLTYLQVNDQIVPRQPGDEYLSYSLFPGTYRFYQSVPDVISAQKTGAVVAFPNEPSDERLVVPTGLTAGKNAVRDLRKAVRQRIDECVTYATPAPYGGCPFATDGEIDTPDGKRVTELHSLTWKVATYPEVELSDDRSETRNPGFALNATRPGTVTLTGSGSDTEGNPATFAVTCDMDLTGMSATIAADGKVVLAPFPRPNSLVNSFNTCHRNA